jgi:hypothetical protein
MHVIALILILVEPPKVFLGVLRSASAKSSAGFKVSERTSAENIDEKAGFGRIGLVCVINQYARDHNTSGRIRSAL